MLVLTNPNIFHQVHNLNKIVKIWNNLTDKIQLKDYSNYITAYQWWCFRSHFNRYLVTDFWEMLTLVRIAAWQWTNVMCHGNYMLFTSSNFEYITYDHGERGVKLAIWIKMAFTSCSFDSNAASCKSKTLGLAHSTPSAIAVYIMGCINVGLVPRWTIL